MLLPLAGSPSQALTRQIPPFVTYGDIFPRSGGSLSSKGEPLAVHANFISLPRPLPLGEVDLRSKDGEGEDAIRCAPAKRNTGTPAGVPVLQNLNKEDQIRLRASSSPTRMKSGCICRMLAGTSGVTGPKKAFLTISALPAPLTTISTLRACMMVRMPMV